MADLLERVLRNLGFAPLLPLFQRDKIDSITIASSLTDVELNRLGISTIGDRIRLREALKNAVKESERPLATPTGASVLRPTTFPRRNQLRSQATRLTCRTWTSTFICLAKRNMEAAPSNEEKNILIKAGLGPKRVTFKSDDSEFDVCCKLESEFNQLSSCGGFELLKWNRANNKLEVLEGRYDVKSLKTRMGSQCKIYVRPIQKDLDTTNIDSEISGASELKTLCMQCSRQFLISEMRKHMEECNATEIHVDEHSDTNEDPFNEQPTATGNDEQQLSNNIEATESTPKTVFEKTIEDCISYLREENINDPVDILRYLQKIIVQGRPLEVGDESEPLEGETNFIVVCRDDLLRTTFLEIKDLQNLRLTLEVEFYEEEARDFGGPRKEFFGLILRAIKEKYFEPVREWSEDYETVGKILALSTLQNGLLPKVMTPDLVQELFGDNPRRFMLDLRRGLDSLGLYKIAVEFPSFQQLFVPTNVTLTLRMMKHVLQPNFSEDGSNRKPLEQLMYSMFVRYLREAAAGRRGDVTLNKVLKFATGSSEEPVLGYTIHPAIHFVNGTTFVPTANTCINRLVLTIPSKEGDMPEEKFLFNLFDNAFLSEFYGMQ